MLLRSWEGRLSIQRVGRVELVFVVCGGRETCLIPSHRLTISLIPCKVLWCLRGRKLSFQVEGRREKKKQRMSCSFRLCCDQERGLGQVKHLSRCPFGIVSVNWNKRVKHQGNKKQCFAMVLETTISRKRTFFLSQTEPPLRCWTAAPSPGLSLYSG